MLTSLSLLAVLRTPEMAADDPLSFNVSVTRNSAIAHVAGTLEAYPARRRGRLFIRRLQHGRLAFHDPLDQEQRCQGFHLGRCFAVLIAVALQGTNGAAGARPVSLDHHFAPPFCLLKHRCAPRPPEPVKMDGVRRSALSARADLFASSNE